MEAAVAEAVTDPELTAAPDEPEPVIVLSHATQVTPTLLVVGWCCWDAPFPTATDCTLAHCVRADCVVVCQRCQREYGVFANRSAPEGALVLTVR